MPDVRMHERTRTGSTSRGACARSAEHTTTAAAPSPIGEHISSVSGSAIIRLPSTSSTVTGVRYCALGFSDA